MNLKPSVRASNGVTSSREESPVLLRASTPKSPAKSRSRHRTKTPLPAVGLKQSTAYGTNNSVQPLRAAGPQVETHISSVLHNILQSQGDLQKSQSQSLDVSSSPSIKSLRSNIKTPDRSFEMENKIFQGAGVVSSITDLDETSPKFQDLLFCSSNSPEFNYLQAHESRNQNSTAIISDENEQLRDRHDDFKLNGSSLKKLPPHKNPRFLSRSWRNFRQTAYYLSSWLLSFKKILLIGLLLLTLLSTSSLTSSNMLPVSRYLPEISPNIITDEANFTKRRLSKLESDISLMQKKITGIDFKADKILEEILPQAVVLRNRNGKLQIAEDFWQAIWDKTHIDGYSVHAEKTKSSRQDDADYGSNNHRYQRIWYQFLSENENKIEQLSDKNLTRQFPQILRENGIVSRAEVIDMIRDNWDKNSALIHQELKSLNLEFKRATRNHEVQLHRMYNQESENLESETVKNLANAQLRAVAQVNIKSGITHSKMRTNHFSKWTGALTLRKSTSPDYVFPSQAKISHAQRLIRLISRNPVPSPRSPEEALNKWEEQGDCWCSPQKGNGFGPSLGVFLGNKIHPEEIVVEHVPSNLALQPGAAPRNLELFAKINESEINPIIWQESRRIFPDLSPDPIAGLEGYVRIAAWIYEIDAPSNIQTHEIPLSLKAFGVDTNEVVVRSITNWGKGNVHYTCLYRLRLFGPISQPHSEL